MLSHVTHLITAAALALAAQASIPGWSSAAVAAPTQKSAHKKCTAKSHRHVAVAAAKPAARGAGGAQLRRAPDIQILSYGP